MGRQAALLHHAAQLAGDQLDLAIYARGEDIHALTAQECFQLTTERWQSMNGKLVKAYRLWAKNFRYGVLLYGGQPETVKARTFCPCTLFGCELKLPDKIGRASCRKECRSRGSPCH